MIYALMNGDIIRAEKGLKANCPLCEGSVIAKCGRLRVWHWAHEVENFECKPSPETEWHLGWKHYFPKEWREQKVGACKADILTPDKISIEFQYSSIDVDTIEKREREHGKLIWIFNGFNFAHEAEFSKKNFYLRINWPDRSEIFDFLKKRLFLDFCHDPERRFLFEVKECTGSSGWGYRMTKESFLRSVAGVQPKFPINQMQGTGPRAIALGKQGWVT